MKAAQQDLEIEQGATYIRPLTWMKRTPGAMPDDPPIIEPVPLVNWRARMQIRKKVGSPVLVAAYSYPTEQEPTPRITLSPAEGKIVIRLEESDTMKLIVTDAVYDLEMVDDNESPARVVRLVEGAVKISPNVTVEEP